MHTLWLLLENNSPKHLALKCLTYYVSYCSLQSDSVVIFYFLFLVFFVLASVLTCRLQKHGKHHLRKYVLKSEKTFSISNVCWTAALETNAWSNNQTQCFLAVLEIFFSSIFFSIISHSGEFTQRSNKL